jgi:hypothetical protein
MSTPLEMWAPPPPLAASPQLPSRPQTTSHRQTQADGGLSSAPASPRRARSQTSSRSDLSAPHVGARLQYTQDTNGGPTPLATAKILLPATAAPPTRLARAPSAPCGGRWASSAPHTRASTPGLGVSSLAVADAIWGPNAVWASGSILASDAVSAAGDIPAADAALATSTSPPHEWSFVTLPPQASTAGGAAADASRARGRAGCQNIRKGAATRRMDCGVSTAAGVGWWWCRTQGNAYGCAPPASIGGCSCCRSGAACICCAPHAPSSMPGHRMSMARGAASASAQGHIMCESYGGAAERTQCRRCGGQCGWPKHAGHGGDVPTTSAGSSHLLSDFTAPPDLHSTDVSSQPSQVFTTPAENARLRSSRQTVPLRRRAPPHPHFPRRHNLTERALRVAEALPGGAAASAVDTSLAVDASFLLPVDVSSTVGASLSVDTTPSPAPSPVRFRLLYPARPDAAAQPPGITPAQSPSPRSPATYPSVSPARCSRSSSRADGQSPGTSTRFERRGLPWDPSCSVESPAQNGSPRLPGPKSAPGRSGPNRLMGPGLPSPNSSLLLAHEASLCSTAALPSRLLAAYRRPAAPADPATGRAAGRSAIARGVCRARNIVREASGGDAQGSAATHAGVRAPAREETHSASQRIPSALGVAQSIVGRAQSVSKEEGDGSLPASRADTPRHPASPSAHTVRCAHTPRQGTLRTTAHDIAISWPELASPRQKLTISPSELVPPWASRPSPPRQPTAPSPHPRSAQLHFPVTSVPHSKGEQHRSPAVALGAAGASRQALSRASSPRHDHDQKRPYTGLPRQAGVASPPRNAASSCSSPRPRLRVARPWLPDRGNGRAVHAVVGSSALVGMLFDG